MKNIMKLIIPAATGILFFACNKDDVSPSDNISVIQSSGDISNDVDAFKAMLGPVNTIPDVVGGHREINWDGVPDSLLDVPLPADFFNQTSANALAANQRGLVYESGTFVVSNNGFQSVNSEAATEFSAFSGNNTFANTTTPRWDVKFQKSGTTENASVDAFGAVFTDVDKDNSTSMEFFDGDESLGKFFVPPHDAKSTFSFLGLRFTNGKRITKVTVTHDGFLAEDLPDISEGGTKDLVVLDDFIYSEPVAE
jgi:hypothetical protein